MNVKLCYLVLYALTVISAVAAQTEDFETSGSEIECKCTPSCSTVGVSECNGRILPRSDCPCCNVCLRQKGESCEEFNAPCEKGLTCSTGGKCQAERNCKLDIECPDDKSCIHNTCVDPCPLFQPCRQSSLLGGICVTKKHVADCDCPKQHKIDRGLNLCVPLQGKANLESEFETNEENPGLTISTKAKKKSIKLIRTDHNSSLILLPTSYGGVLHYKDSKSGDDFSRLTAKTGHTELMVEGLKPLTKYTLKWVGNDGNEDKFQIKTEDGCLDGPMTSYSVGSKWNRDCFQKCACYSGGQVRCLSRCIFVKGSIQDDHCTEITSQSDPECCVEYACRNSSEPKIVDVPNKSKKMLQNIEGKLIVTSRTEDSITVAWENFREINADEGYVAEYRTEEIPKETATWMQQEVPRGPLPPTMTIENLQPSSIYQVRVGLYKESTEKELVAKTETITVKTRKIDPCMKKHCGPNSHCDPSVTSTELAKCTCDPGFYFDLESSSCKLDKNYSSDITGCRFQGKEYSPGDDFYDGCMFKCTCDLHSEIDCQPRCQFTIDSKDTEDCRFFTDPEDNCCKLKVCNTTLESPYNSIQSSSLDFDGCTYSNNTYKKNEKFTIGCELRCLCMGLGDVSCYPRCPPIKETSTNEDDICTILSDPHDNCCSVTICDNSTSEVLKDKEILVEEEVIMAGAEKKDSNTTSDIRHASSKNTTTKESATTKKNATSSIKISNTTLSNIHVTAKTTITKNSSMTTNSTAKLLSHVTNLQSTTTLHKENTTTIPTTLANSTSIVSLVGNLTGKLGIIKNITNGPIISNHSLTSMPISKNKQAIHLNGTIANAISTKTVIAMTPANNISGRSSARSSPSSVLSNVNTSSILPIATTVGVTSDISNVNKSIHERKLRLTDSNIHIAHLEILDVHKMDAETVQIKVKVSQDIMAELLSFTKDPIIVSYSHDSVTWKNQSILIGGIEILSVNTISFSVHILNGAVPNMLKIYYKQASSPIKISNILGKDSLLKPKTDFLKSGKVCKYKEKSYKIGDEFYDACESFCVCTKESEVFCAPIKCPDKFGLDIMDPGCLEWKEEENYIPVPPRCCRRKPRCILRIEDFSCTIEGITFDHLDVLPLKFSKCNQRCQCIKGHIDCENLCSPVQATPPHNLPCPPNQATIVKNKGYPCCPEWQCVNISNVNVYPPLPPGFSRPKPSNRPQQTAQRIFLPIILDASSTSVQLSFKIPRYFVGLPGGIYLRYTPSSSSQTNTLHWQSEVIHEDGLTLSGVDWVYKKTSLQPDTNYSMQVVLSSRLAKNEIVSPIFSIKTLGIATSPLPRLELNAALKIGDIKNISSKVSWRQFTDYELKYIDGIGVRYWPVGKKFPLEGPMLHRKADNYVLKDLKPNTGYTVDLIFQTPDGYSTNVFNTHNVTFKTLPKPKDKYDFNITIKMGNITKKGVQILYSGVTEPEGIYVNVFRVVYTTDGDLKDSHKFKVPKNQKEGFILLTDLKPGIAYEVWLEAYLTNGVKKKSNVITIHTDHEKLTKPGSITDDEVQEKEGSHYYTAFIWVSVLAALACIALVILILYICRRQNHAKAQISAKGSYENPSYKGTGVGYGIEMNGMKSNGNSRDEV